MHTHSHPCSWLLLHPTNKQEALISHELLKKVVWEWILLDKSSIWNASQKIHYKKFNTWLQSPFELYKNHTSLPIHSKKLMQNNFHLHKDSTNSSQEHLFFIYFWTGVIVRMNWFHTIYDFEELQRRNNHPTLCITTPMRWLNKINKPKIFILQLNRAMQFVPTDHAIRLCN